MTSITATSISLSWSVPSDSVVTSYEVTWWKSGSDASTSVTVSEAHVNYTITGLDSNTDYSVTVTAINGAGSATSSPILVSTSEVCAGMYCFIVCGCLSYSSMLHRIQHHWSYCRRSAGSCILPECHCHCGGYSSYTACKTEPSQT